MSIYPSKYAPIPVPDLNNWNTDRDVEPVVMTRGIMYKTGGAWYFWDGLSRSDDAGLMRVSSVGGGTVTFDGDATNNRVSAFSDDASLMRVSAVGLTTTGLSANQSISSLGLEGTAHIGQVSAILVDNPINATYLGRVSGIIDSGSISAKSGDATQVRISAFSDNASLFRVSAVGLTTTGLSANQSISAVNMEGSAFIGQVSAILKDNPINATYLGRVSTVGSVAISANQQLSAYLIEATGHIGSVSAVLVDDASTTKFLGRVSALGVTASLDADAVNNRVSAFSNDAGLMRVSSVGGSTVSLSADAVGNRVSSFQTDAGLLRVSSLWSQRLDATNDTISAVQGDASSLRISAFSDDASKFRVYVVSGATGGVSANQSISALGLEGTAHIGQVSAILVDNPVNATYLGRVSTVGSVAVSANQSLSALMLEGSAFIGQVSAILKDNPTTATYLGHVSAYQEAATDLRISAFSLTASTMVVSAAQNDAALLHVSAIGTMTVSSHEVKQSDAAALRISAYADDAAKFRVSAINFTVGLSANQQVSARALEGSAFIGSVSSNQAGTWAISALMKEGTAFIGQVSVAGGQLSATIKEGSAFIGQVSAILKDNPTNATYLGHVSAYMGDAVNLNISAKSNDAGTLRTSSFIPVDTVGGLTVFQTLSISASQNIKATAATLYGYYLYNTDTKPNYIKLYNVSAAANIGTDTPIMTICLPASAAANAWFGQGLKGFTNGINITATSGRPLDNTALPAASAVGGDIFYN